MSKRKCRRSVTDILADVEQPLVTRTSGTPILQRRTFMLLGIAALSQSTRAAARSRGTRTLAAAEHGAYAASFAKIEAASGGRLGVYARDVASGRTIAYRARERFPMCSTFKVLAVAAILQRIDRGTERLAREVRYGKADLQEYAPVARTHVTAAKMTISELCEAAIVMSDNTAANLLLRALGGPGAVTAFVRAQPFDDRVTRLDRSEPALNSATPGDPRDTTEPATMVDALALLLATNRVLTKTSSRMLEAWMTACTTGTDALRAGVPRAWKAGDKTGSGANGTRNDVAIFRRDGKPLIVAAYLTGASAIDIDARDASLAAVGHIVAAALTAT